MTIDKSTLLQIQSFIENVVLLMKIEVKEDNLDTLIDQAVLQLNSMGALEKIILDEGSKKSIRKELEARFAIEHTHGISIDNDGDGIRDWYTNMDKTDEIFWPKYRQYLIDVEHYDIASVNLLGNTTLNEIMDYLGDPRPDSNDKPLRRGLVIGDVQSGKTSTYSGLICKAADSGYRVVILLTGVTESLRKQTQERMDEGIIGISTEIVQTGKKKTSVPKRVGVGLDNLEIRATALTSIDNDFKRNSSNIITSLSNFNLLMFIVKKNTTILQRMYDWLYNINADPSDHKIHFPMLLIDDEADNASINTKKEGNDPTKTNKLIRQLCNVFSKSTYVGFTATPFANVFIDPETTEQMENSDLFPEDFMYALPVPSNYIGAQKLYGDDAPLRGCLRYIDDILEPSGDDLAEEEAEGVDLLTRPLYYKHSKEWCGELPHSLDEAICAFFLANVIRDLRGDEDAARTMLVNISRFVKVQQYTYEYIKNYYNKIYRAIKYDFSDLTSNNEKLDVYIELKNAWDRNYKKNEFNWEDVCNKQQLLSAIENIDIVVVNGGSNSGGIDYKKNPSARIIAVGGLALSRGLTLKGLITSYFYRNTRTFDVLMQMGRWFGYRPHYEDICRIWTSYETASYYKEISDATEELKEDLQRMNYLKQTPRDFGIRVRNDSEELQITAANKMRMSFDKEILMNFWGHLFETPYLSGYEKSHTNNINVIHSVIKDLNSAGYKFEDVNPSKKLGSKIVRNAPKAFISKLMHELAIYPQNKFDQKQLMDFIDVEDSQYLDKWDILFRSGDAKDTFSLNDKCQIKLVSRTFSLAEKRLSISRRGKLGGTEEGAMGLDPALVEAAKTQFHSDHPGKQYTSNTWFEYLNVTQRRPMLMIFLLDICVPKDDTGKPVKHCQDFKDKLQDTPVVGIGLGFPANGMTSGKNKYYKINKVYYLQELGAALNDAEEDEDYE